MGLNPQLVQYLLKHVFPLRHNPVPSILHEGNSEIGCFKFHSVLAACFCVAKIHCSQAKCQM